MATTIETAGGDHSGNMDELLDYLRREEKTRRELAAANFNNEDRSKRELAMAEHYRHMYEAAQFYRKNAE